MALKTDYKDDILNTDVNTKRKYNLIENDDGTYSLEDVTVYKQIGDTYSASDVNETNAFVNEFYDELVKKESGIIRFLNGRKIEYGTVTNITVPASGNATIKVTFPEPFESTPKIFCEELGQYNIIARPAGNGDGTEFSIVVRSLTQIAYTGRSVNWFAIG